MLYVVYASVDTMPLEFLYNYLFARRYPEQRPPRAIYHSFRFCQILFFSIFLHPRNACTLFFRKKNRNIGGQYTTKRETSQHHNCIFRGKSVKNESKVALSSSVVLVFFRKRFKQKVEINSTEKE